MSIEGGERIYVPSRKVFWNQSIRRLAGFYIAEFVVGTWTKAAGA